MCAALVHYADEMLRCPVDVFARLRTFVGFHQYLCMDTPFRSIKQTHGPCSQVCPDLNKYFHKEVALIEDNGNPIEYKDGMETLRVCLTSVLAADVAANFADAFYLLPESVTPVRSLEVHFPNVIIGTIVDEIYLSGSSELNDEPYHWLVYYVENAGEYRTRIRIYFEECVKARHLHSRIAIARMIHEILRDYSVNLRASYRGESIGTGQVLEILRERIFQPGFDS